MYTYVHDLDGLSVYQLSTARVTDETDKRGRVTGWTVSMEVLISRADNSLTRGQWLHPTSSYPSQHFPATQHTREHTVPYFMRHHTPAGIEITAEEYRTLQTAYDAAARKPKS